MSFDWRPESKDRYFRKAEAAVKAAGFDDILQISKEQFAITKSTVKVYFKPIPREGKTRRWWEAKKSITGMQEQSGGRDEFGRKKENHFYSCLYDFRNGGAGQVRAGEIIERIRHMLKVKDCKHVCLFCEYYDMCKEEAKANEHEICKEK
jgi:hypothetical protein